MSKYCIPGRFVKAFNVLCILAGSLAVTRADIPEPVTLDSGWTLQDSAKVSQTGSDISQAAFQHANWYAAVVPGTVLTTLVADGVYPEPLYGENNRPDKIP